MPYRREKREYTSYAIIIIRSLNGNTQWVSGANGPELSLSYLLTRLGGQDVRKEAWKVGLYIFRIM